MGDKRSYAPVYCALYPELKDFFKGQGYALAIHGSMARDFDLIAIPWIKGVQKKDVIIERLCDVFGFNLIGEPETKNHFRIAYTLSVGHGECFIDLSFMPAVVHVESPRLVLIDND